jgi:hypothetical protein
MKRMRMSGLDLKDLGIPDRFELLKEYCDRNLNVSLNEAVNWSGFYLAFLFFKNCVIVQGVAQRAKAGVASSAIASRVATLLPTVLRITQEILQQYPPPIDIRSRL